jgi:multiple sugar transport system ATP-binding protein
MAEIRLENIMRRYGAVTALNGVSATITSGFTSIFGPPGAGKSVLLRVLLGLERPDRGRILIDGRDVTDLGPTERNLAMVFQNLALFPQLTARENILFPMRRRPMPEPEVTARLGRIASVLNIGHILSKRPAQLSGGERQRVAIARALIRDASAWMMDEPIAALDARLRETARVELKRLQRAEGRTFVYVTHDCDEAMSVADQMIILDKGQVIQTGTPDEVYARPASAAVASLVGMPGINLIDASIADGVAMTAFGALPLLAPAGAVRLAVRPEAVALADPSASALAARVADVEVLGDHAILGAEAGGARLRLIVDGAPGVGIGDRIGLTFAASGLHVFDPVSGLRLADAGVPA